MKKFFRALRAHYFIPAFAFLFRSYDYWEAKELDAAGLARIHVNSGWRKP